MNTAGDGKEEPHESNDPGMIKIGLPKRALWRMDEGQP